jgi:catechol 2,3-dioxygenase-like lactoylglutathione lyase family enzyme
MDWTLELVVVPVSDVDRAKAFYLDRMGFDLNVDTSPSENFRVVQMTPPGSACSIAIGTGIGQMEPGSLKGLHLCVSDIEAAHAQCVERGAEPSDPYHFGASGKADGLDPERRSYATFFDFADPDGNVWLVQEVKR